MSEIDLVTVHRTDGVTIELDQNKCIGAGPCAISASHVFKIREEDGKATIDNPDGDDLSAVIEAANSCPVFAIIIKDKNGQKIN